jgi:hypothetical protein
MTDQFALVDFSLPYYLWWSELDMETTHDAGHENVFCGMQLSFVLILLLWSNIMLL